MSYIISEWFLFNAKWAVFKLYHVTFQWDVEDVGFVLENTDARMDFYSDCSLKQQSASRNVAPLGHIILIQSQSVFDLPL